MRSASDARASLAPTPRENVLLRALPAPDLGSIAVDLHRVELEQQDLYAIGHAIDRVYFPVSGLISVVMELESGSTIEVGTIDREGMAGLSLFFGAQTSAYRVLSQIAGTSYALDALSFQTHLARSGALRSILNRYARAYLAMTSQTAACNGSHRIKQRIARWLLISHDAARAPRFVLTQEFLSHMLGVERPSVTAAALELQRGGAIAYHRGHVEILDRAKLEHATCECYATVRAIFDQMLD